jgi:hypothetical protein
LEKKQLYNKDDELEERQQLEQQCTNKDNLNKEKSNSGEKHIKKEEIALRITDIGEDERVKKRCCEMKNEIISKEDKVDKEIKEREKRRNKKLVEKRSIGAENCWQNLQSEESKLKANLAIIDKQSVVIAKQSNIQIEKSAEVCQTAEKSKEVVKEAVNQAVNLSKNAEINVQMEDIKIATKPQEIEKVTNFSENWSKDKYKVAKPMIGFQLNHGLLVKMQRIVARLQINSIPELQKNEEGLFDVNVECSNLRQMRYLQQYTRNWIVYRKRIKGQIAYVDNQQTRRQRFAHVPQNLRTCPKKIMVKIGKDIPLKLKPIWKP